MAFDYMNLLEKVSGIPKHTLRAARKQFNFKFNQKMKGIMKPTSGYALPSFFTTFSSLIYSTFPEMGYHYKLQNGQEGWIWVQKRPNKRPRMKLA